MKGKERKNKFAKNPSKGIPVGLYALGEEDSEFWHVDNKGRSPRVMVEDVCGDKFYFSNDKDPKGQTAEQKARLWIKIHGCRATSDKDLHRLKRQEAPDAPEE